MIDPNPKVSTWTTSIGQTTLVPSMNAHNAHLGQILLTGPGMYIDSGLHYSGQLPVSFPTQRLGMRQGSSGRSQNGDAHFLLAVGLVRSGFSHLKDPYF